MYLEKHPITSPYRPKNRPDHTGVDFATPIGTDVPALADGVVSYEGYSAPAAPGWPLEILCIVQGDGFFDVYGHLLQTLVNTGQRVKAGQVIARSGNSGYSFGPHLHIERRRGTKASGKSITAYPDIDITPALKAYGSKEAAPDMTVFIRPIAMLKVNLKKPLQMYNVVTGEKLWNSGDYMELTGKTNIVRGQSFLIPVDRMNKGEPLGFLEHEVFASGNKVHDTQHDAKPGIDPMIIEKARRYDELKKLFEGGELYDSIT